MEAGAVLRDRYHIDAIAGAGGMGTVYRATDRETNRVCAVKLLAPNASERTRERFVHEAAILARVSDPAIVRYLDHGEDPPFLVMEWVDGESLADRLRRSGATPGEALRVSARLVRGLAAAHAAGVVHRDLKPRNVMLPEGSFDDAKIVDFGVARVQRDLALGNTGTGVRLGTPRYMAPEQIVSSRRVDGRADIFSLGCVLFEMLTGRRAFRGDDEVALLARMVIEDAPRVRSIRAEIPLEVDALVARLLVRDYRLRPHASAELAEELAMIGAELATMGVAHVVDSANESTAENTPDLTFASAPDLTPLPPPSVLPWATVGRDVVRAELLQALAPGAVVGLWGALGIGKSHLAQDVARRVWASRGAIVVDLRSASDADDVVRRIAAELGLVHAASVEDICAAVNGRGGPVVVLDGETDLVALAKRIVVEAPLASVIVISRERPSGVANAIELGPLDEASSIDLFVARSRGAADAARDAAMLETIARALSGNPLALTLAASRASVIGVAAIAPRLERPLDVLGSARTDAYPVSLRDAIEAVWETLSEGERWVAMCCAMFPGAIRPNIVELVSASVLDHGASALDGLEALRDKSLLRPAPRETLVMDPAFRDFARDKFAEFGEISPDRVTRAHAAFSREIIARAAPLDVLAREGDADALATLFAFEADLILAFERAADAELSLTAALALESSLVARGPLDRLAAVLDRALSAPNTRSAIVARVHAARGRVASLRAAYDVARSSFDAALAIAREIGDAELEASVWLDLGVMHHARGELADAQRCYATVLDLHDADASRAEARAQGNLGALAHDRGELDAAYTYYVRAIAVAESIGDARLLGVFLCNLAVLDRERGRAPLARQRFVRALHALETGRDRRLIGITRGNLGMLELELGRTAEARAAFERSAELLAALGDSHSEALAQARLGAVLAMTNNVDAADAALARAERLSARDENTRAVVRFFRAFPEAARAMAGGDAREAFRDRARARVAAINPLMGGADDDVRAALRVLERWAHDVLR